MDRTVVAVCLTAILIVTAGCTAAATPTATPSRNATLSLPDYERTAAAAPIDTRAFWDRSSNWEAPHERNVTVTSQVYAYRATAGNTTVAVYTTPKRPYAAPDRIRTYAAPRLADLATAALAVQPRGTDTGRNYTASLLNTTVTVRPVVDETGTTTAHVARLTTGRVIVVVVVMGEVDTETVGRVLGGVTF